jgi:hypothetical protein
MLYIIVNNNNNNNNEGQVEAMRIAIIAYWFVLAVFLVGLTLHANSRTHAVLQQPL